MAKVLAVTDPCLLPSACDDGIGTPDSIAFAAPYLASTPPYQRFTYHLTANDWGSLWIATPSL
jgi:hypothetical protein